MAKRRTGKKAAKKKASGRRSAASTGSTHRKKSAARHKPHVSLEQPPRVRVRMFRQGLGDCFLVTFDVDGDERHMLIDCGTLGKKATKVATDDIANHLLDLIAKKKGGGGTQGKLDVVVATHEHFDHLSGFNVKSMQQLKGKVAQVWVAWTEDPNDTDAKDLARVTQDLGKGLAGIAAAVSDSEIGRDLKNLLEFASEDGMLGADFAKTVHQAMEFVRKGLDAEVKYCNPGDLIEEEWLPGFRVFILGPPRDRDRIRELGEHGSDELYGLHLAATLRAKHRENKSLKADELAECEEQRPFDLRFAVDDEELSHRHYPHYYEHNSDWRTVDEDWLNLASYFALQLDSQTNNTSLVLAIERIADGKVLLFPADAQQGNWLSWHEPNLKWTFKDASGRERIVTAEDLLNRTVFYKVGHHGSHNATGSNQGLEMMLQEDELTAFIPVDRQIAMNRGKKRSWQMPARALYLRLLQKCQGRVVRSDIAWAAPAKKNDEVERELWNLADDKQWEEWRLHQDKATHIQEHEHYIDFTLE